MYIYIYIKLGMFGGNNTISKDTSSYHMHILYLLNLKFIIYEGKKKKKGKCKVVSQVVY